MDPAIKCFDVKRVFNFRSLFGKKQETVALDGLNLEIPHGIVFGLLGPNGSGKTTTVKILSTLLTPTSGEAIVLGHDVVKEANKVREHIGLILGGERGLYGRLTGEENLNYFAALNHINKDKAKQRISEVIKLVNLQDVAKRLVEQYSRGMKQRLHIARGLLTDPEILFMDEPTIGLDPVGAMELRQLIPTLVQKGKTILLTTHYMSEADELSTQLAIISRGKVIAFGTPREIKHTFSKIEVCEVLYRNAAINVTQLMQNIKEVQRANVVTDGPIQKLILHIVPNFEIKPEVKKIIGEPNIESIIMREPTLEEAYLNIIK
jgi:ABC-2 type transport system ATP-binding protein